MAVSWARRIGNIRTPMPITNAELSSISAAPVTNNAVEPLRSPERTMSVAMRLLRHMPRSPQGKGPQRFGRSDARWSPGERLEGRSSGRRRVSRPGAKWPWSVVQSANATACVGRGWGPGAASDAMTTTTSHPTPDTRLIASGGEPSKANHALLGRAAFAAGHCRFRVWQQRLGRSPDVVIALCDAAVSHPRHRYSSARVPVGAYPTSAVFHVARPRRGARAIMRRPAASGPETTGGAGDAGWPSGSVRAVKAADEHERRYDDRGEGREERSRDEPDDDEGD